MTNKEQGSSFRVFRSIQKVRIHHKTMERLAVIPVRRRSEVALQELRDYYVLRDLPDQPDRLRKTGSRPFLRFSEEFNKEWNSDKNEESGHQNQLNEDDF